MQNNAAIVWFKNDMRLHDNETLYTAVKANLQIMPIFILDPRWCCSTIYGFRKTGNIRMKFIKDCAAALQASLQAIGSDLYFFEGLPEKIIPELIKKYNIGQVYTKKEFGCDEKIIVQKVEKICEIMHVAFHQFHTQNCLDFNTINLELFPDNFDDALPLLTNNQLLQPCLPAVTQLNPLVCYTSEPIDIFDKYYSDNKLTDCPHTCFPFSGGEAAAIQRLQSFIFDYKEIKHLHLTQTQNKTPNYSTKFSPWLAQGCISARYIYHQVLEYCKTYPNCKGAETLRISILLRDFFYITFIKYGIKYFRQGGIHNKSLICIKDFEVLQTWLSAKTEDDYINANMQEIAKTGWLSYIGRQHVAQYLSKNMLIDWRIGAAYFESQLLDYDVCLNYANWAEKAGVGCQDCQESSALNMNEIKSEYDNDGEYRALWIEA